MSDSAVNVDMYRDYPGYRIIDRSEIDQALTKALVVVDTNLLLNLYRYAEGTCDDLLGVLGSLGDRLWIPPQVMREFWRGRLSVLTGRGSATDAVIAALEKQQRAGADAINQWVKSIAVDPDEAVRLRKVLASAHDEVAKTVLMHAPPQAVNPSVTDPVLQRLETLLVGKVGPIPDAGRGRRRSPREKRGPRTRHHRASVTSPKRNRISRRARPGTIWSGRSPWPRPSAATWT